MILHNLFFLIAPVEPALLQVFRKGWKHLEASGVHPDSPGAALKPMPVPVLPPGTRFAKFSPDGRWLAYGSEEPQRSEVYVSPFLRPGGKRQISTKASSRAGVRTERKYSTFLRTDG